MQNDRYNELYNDVDVLDVVPDKNNGIKQYDIYRKVKIRRFLFFSSAFFVLVGIAAIVINNRANAYLLNKSTLEGNAKYCAQVLFMKVNNNEWDFDFRECNSVVSQLPLDNEWVVLYEFGKEYLTFHHRYHNNFNANYDYNKSFIYFEENFTKYDAAYTTAFKNDLTNIKNDYNLYQSVYYDSVALLKDLELGNKTDEEYEFSYNNVKFAYSQLMDLAQKEELTSNMNSIDTKMETLKNRASRKQEMVSNSWTILSIPYISQNENRVYNGCEVACLLMSLQYKGYSLDKKLSDFAKSIPKSDNPEEGFYLSIYNQDPTDEAHWIAPEALKNFGNSQSESNNVINTTSWDLSQLDEEVLKGNPVIIYLTSSLENPRNFKNGAPQNLHVLILAGYNPVTREQLIIDPWNYYIASSYWIVSYDKVEKIYDAVGKKSLVVK